MTTRQISETIDDIYGFEASEDFISDITDKILPPIEDWQNRPLDEVYLIHYMDAIHDSVRDNGVIRKLAAYVIIGINTEGKQAVLTINVGDHEGSKYWLSVLNELKKQKGKEYLDPLCRWSEWHERSHCCGIFKNRVSTLHCSSSKEHVKVCTG